MMIESNMVLELILKDGVERSKWREKVLKIIFVFSSVFVLCSLLLIRTPTGVFILIASLGVSIVTLRFISQEKIVRIEAEKQIKRLEEINF